MKKFSKLDLLPGDLCPKCNNPCVLELMHYVCPTCIEINEALDNWIEFDDNTEPLFRLPFTGQDD